MSKEVYGYIYMVKNLVNGKIYFGITVNDFQRRYDGNIAKYTHNDHLRNSINTYGIENFEINEEFDVAYTEDDLWDLEDMYICLYNTLDEHYGYNKKRSGSKYKGSGKFNDESKHRVSDGLKEKWKDEEFKRKMCNSRKQQYKQGRINPMKGKNLTKEHREKISDSLKGNKNPRAKMVVCLDTLQIFSTGKEAGEWCNCCKQGICQCCKGRCKTAGKHPITGEKLHWMYYEDYLKLQEKNSNNNKVA